MENAKLKQEIEKLENKKRTIAENKELNKKLKKLKEELREKSKLEKSLKFVGKGFAMFGKRIAKHINEKNNKTKK